MGDYHVRFRERFRGETPLYLLDVTQKECSSLNKISVNEENFSYLD
jgi:hypothetical protein